MEFHVFNTDELTKEILFSDHKSKMDTDIIFIHHTKVLRAAKDGIEEKSNVQSHTVLKTMLIAVSSQKVNTTFDLNFILYIFSKRFTT
jgi:hypothetical protein